MGPRNQPPKKRAKRRPSASSTTAPTAPATAAVSTAALLRLIGRGTGEERAAAAIVLGALRPGGAAVERALIGALRRAPVIEQPYLLDALARQGGRAGLGVVAPLLASSGALREQAVRLMACFGAPAAPAISRGFDARGTAPEGAFIKAAALLGEPAAVDWLVDLLATGDFVRARRIYVAVRAAVPSWRAVVRTRLVTAVLVALRAGRFDHELATVITALKLLRLAPAAAALSQVLVRTQPDFPLAVRGQAVATLHVLPVAARQRASVAAALEPLVFEPHTRRLALPAFVVLKRQRPPLCDRNMLQRIAADAHEPMRSEAQRLLAVPISAALRSDL